MKCISKSVEFRVIKVSDNREFYIELGKCINKENYRVEKSNERYYEKVILILNKQEIEIKEGNYILISQENGNIRYITEEEYKAEYAELVEKED